MPNLFAYAMLLAWPLVTGMLFARLSVQRAILWSLFSGFLLLPLRTEIDLPLLPPFDKTTIPSLVLLGFLLVQAREKPQLIPRSNVAKILLLLLLVGPFFTGMLNDQRLVYGWRVLPALGLWDGFSMAAQTFIQLSPFLIARYYFATPEGHRLILKVFVAACLAYSLPMLFEIRFSPQLHDWVYGFFPHTWRQMYRFGGYRPLVFMPHGLEVALFTAMAAGAAAVLWRMAAPPERGRAVLIVVYLAVMVVLCKTVSAWVYALVLLPVLLTVGPRLQVWIAAAMVALTLAYPLLRGNDLFPTGAVVDTFKPVSEARAKSLEGRFEMENLLLDHAKKRPLFGWGQSGRNRLYHEEKGHSMTVTDGSWIMTFGTTGWAGFIGTFGLLGLPVLLLLVRARREIPVATAGVAVLLAINMVDMLPNSSLWPLSWLMAGGLLGYAESLARAPETPRRRRTPVRDRGGGPESPAPAAAGTGSGEPRPPTRRERPPPARRRAPLPRNRAEGRQPKA